MQIHFGGHEDNFNNIQFLDETYIKLKYTRCTWHINLILCGYVVFIDDVTSFLTVYRQNFYFLYYFIHNWFL